MVSGKSVKSGRPPRAENERIRTIAWFNAVQIALEVDKPTAVGCRIQAASDALGPKGWSGDLKDSNRWSRYAKGSETPSEGILLFVNKAVPDSAHVFQRGPSDLWLVLWANNEFQIGYEDIDALYNIKPDGINFQWLGRVIAAWRKKGGADGLYEAIMLGLNSPAIKSPLDRLNVWESICADIRATERRYLLRDVKRADEIFMIGRHFLKIDNPIEAYLFDPVGFSTKAISADLDASTICIPLNQ